jgi:predicted nuclease of predicted toxin-antitoxin system
MKLLFDQNLSSRLVVALADLFPGSAHVRELGLHETSDAAVWDYAVAHDFAIVTKDQDFSDRVALVDSPAKVVWIRLGNCPTKHVEGLLRLRHQQIQAFGAQGDDFLLSIP